MMGSRNTKRKLKKEKRRKQKIRRELAARRQEVRKRDKQDKEAQKSLDLIGQPETVDIGPVKPFELDSQKNEEASSQYLTQDKKPDDEKQG